MSFVPATRDLAFLRLLLWGEAGGGKSYTALLTLSALVASALGHPEWVAVGENGQLTIDQNLEPHIAVIDGEARVREYAGGRPFYFHLEEPLDFKEDTLLPIIDSARRRGFLGVLFDPFSHVWQANGGILELQGELGGSFKDWGPAKASYRRILNRLVGLEAHVIATARAKVERVVEGKTIKSNGLQPIGEETCEYEFSMVGRMSAAGTMALLKSATPTLPAGEVLEKPALSFAKKLTEWLHPSGTPGAFSAMRAEILSAKSLEDALKVKERFSVELKHNALTLREADVLKTMLIDLGQRLGLGKKAEVA